MAIAYHNKSKGYIAIMSFVLLACFYTFMGYYWPNMNWPDEIFQSVEQAHRLVFGNGLIPWEYRDGLRSYIFPGLLSVFVWLGQSFGTGSSGYHVAVITALAITSLLPLWALLTYKKWQPREILIIIFSTGLWFELVYFSTKASTEVFCGNIIISSILFLSYEGAISNKKYIDIILGMLIGIAAGIRIQYMPVVLAFVAYRYFSGKSLMIIILGMMLGATAVGMIDFITWGTPFHSIIMNIQKNLIEDVASKFGTSPWHFYFSERFAVLGWYLLPLTLLVLLGVKQCPLMALLLLATILPHLFIGHKEFRFIYLGYWCFIALAGLGSIQLVRFLSAFSIKYGNAGVVMLSLFWLFSSTQLGLSYKGWYSARDTFLAYRAMSKDMDVCGLGTIGIRWHNSGGYYFLHHNVPIVEVQNFQVLRGAGLPYNRLVIKFNRKGMPDPEKQAPERIGYFDKLKCWDSVCIYASEKGCSYSDPIDYNR